MYSSINYFFGINQMYIVGSSYWNLGVNPNPGNPGAIEEDSEGISTFQNLGKNFAHILKKLNN